MLLFLYSTAYYIGDWTSFLSRLHYDLLCIFPNGTWNFIFRSFAFDSNRRYFGEIYIFTGRFWSSSNMHVGFDSKMLFALLSNRSSFLQTVVQITYVITTSRLIFHHRNFVVTSLANKKKNQYPTRLISLHLLFYPLQRISKPNCSQVQISVFAKRDAVNRNILPNCNTNVTSKPPLMLKMSVISPFSSLVLCTLRMHFYFNDVFYVLYATDLVYKSTLICYRSHALSTSQILFAALHGLLYEITTQPRNVMVSLPTPRIWDTISLT